MSFVRRDDYLLLRHRDLCYSSLPSEVSSFSYIDWISHPGTLALCVHIWCVQ